VAHLGAHLRVCRPMRYCYLQYPLCTSSSDDLQASPRYRVTSACCIRSAAPQVGRFIASTPRSVEDLYGRGPSRCRRDQRTVEGLHCAHLRAGPATATDPARSRAGIARALRPADVTRCERKPRELPDISPSCEINCYIEASSDLLLMAAGPWALEPSLTRLSAW
jgi:hypothetical protein